MQRELKGANEADKHAERFDGYTLTQLKQALKFEETYDEYEIAHSTMRNLLTNAMGEWISNPKSVVSVMDDIVEQVKWYKVSLKRRTKRMKRLKRLIEDME